MPAGAGVPRLSSESFESFRAMAAPGAGAALQGARIVPVSIEIVLDADTPVSAYHKVRRGPFGFLLESAPAGGETWSRYTFLGTEPRSAWRLRGRIVEDWDPARGWHSPRSPIDPLADLDALVSVATPVEAPELGEFWTGAVGFFGYDVVRLIENLPNRPGTAFNTDDTDNTDGTDDTTTTETDKGVTAERRAGQGELPDAMFVFTSSMVIIDNLRSRARIVVGVVVNHDMGEDQLRRLHGEALSEIESIKERLSSAATLVPITLSSNAAPAAGRSSIGRDDFIERVDRIKEYIRAGDCFQALLSRRIELEADFDPALLYRALRALNPSPYMYHLTLDGADIVGSSPELLVRLAGGHVTVRPIAGTRPRGATPERDAELSRELLADQKERAEHIMLVDLGRNDVGRVARYGTVKVTEMMQIEKYSHVLHIVSQVEGDVAGEKSAMDVFRATFPAGTMTGAPKVRAMQIIDELEPVSRGAYAGAIGYIAGGGKRMDLAITIRTCVIANGIASVQAGAGIVADSVGTSEWDETENKARAVLTAIGQARAAT